MILSVGNGYVLDLLGAHHRTHVHLLAVLLHGNARTCEGQVQRSAALDEAAESLKRETNRCISMV